MELEIYEEKFSKDCPVCGDESFVADINIFYQVECLNPNCGLAGPKSLERNVAIELWNRLNFETFEEQAYQFALKKVERVIGMVRKRLPFY